MNNEKIYMNIYTGSTGTSDDWDGYVESGNLLEVELDENGDWTEVE